MPPFAAGTPPAGRCPPPPHIVSTHAACLKSPDADLKCSWGVGGRGGGRAGVIQTRLLCTEHTKEPAEATAVCPPRPRLAWPGHLRLESICFRSCSVPGATEEPCSTERGDDVSLSVHTHAHLAPTVPPGCSMHPPRRPAGSCSQRWPGQAQAGLALLGPERARGGQQKGTGSPLVVLGWHLLALTTGRVGARWFLAGRQRVATEPPRPPAAAAF